MPDFLKELREKRERVLSREGPKPLMLGRSFTHLFDTLDWVIYSRGRHEKESSMTDEEWYALAREMDERAERKAAWQAGVYAEDVRMEVMQLEYESMELLNDVPKEGE